METKIEFTRINNDVNGFEGLYQVNEDGLVFNSVTGKEIKHRNHSSGYSSVCLYKDKKPHYALVHRIVAKAFISNPENKPCVGHKNTNKKDNRVDNLEWVTYSENNSNPITVNKRSESENKPMKGRTGSSHPISKTVGKYDVEMNLLDQFGSVREAGRKLGIPHGSIYQVCLGRRKTLHGFIFKYI